jgi:hypothetical protein
MQGRLRAAFGVLPSSYFKEVPTPQLQRESRIDIDYSTMPIPADARMPKFALTMAWWAMCSGMF